MKLLKENHDAKLVNFLRQNRNLILINDFDELYEKWLKLDNVTVSMLTNILLGAEIDPLLYMTKIFDYMYCNLPITSITIPNSIKEIGTYAFANCKSLTNIIIPNSVKEIGICAFGNCPQLTNITIPNSVIEIRHYAFADCINLKNIAIPNSVTVIDDQVFMGCINLTNVIIPNSIERISMCAFRNCANLTSITIPNSVLGIGLDAFDPTTKIIYEGSEIEWKQIEGSDYYKNYEIEFLNK